MPQVKKVALNKKALFKFLAQDKEGNYIPTQARRKKRVSDGAIVEDLTNGSFDELLKKDSNRSVHQYTEQESGTIVEQIITSETNDMIVYKGIVFYKSSATSGSETGDTNRLNTWIPSLGLDDKSSHGLGSIGSTFKITKLDKFYDRQFSKPDERIKKYKDYLGDDLMMRLNNFDIMLMSAEIGGGFWDTDKGKSLIHKLRDEGLTIKVGKVSISPKSQMEFDIPFEVKEDDNDLIKTLTEKSNSFLEEQGGYLHKGLVLGAEQQKSVSQRPDVYQEICDRARKATCEYRNYPES